MLVSLKSFFFFFFFFFFLALSANTHAFSHKDSVPNLIRGDGYAVEVHHVTTDDGYILELHRIPYGRNESSGGRFQRPVVFMAHCLMCSSSAYVVLGPNGGLAYMLANQGFDVWMLNSRGNDYSQKHLTLSNKSRKFWQFSWHEQGTFDMPAGIDYVLNKTGERQLDAIGYSMGTTQLFVMLSERPEYNNKLRSFTALAPAVFLGSSSAAMVQLAFSIQDIVIKVRAETGRLEMAGRSSGLKDLFQALCQPQNFIFRKFCIKALILAGGTSANINLKTLPFYFKYFPEPTSLRTLVHFLQIIKEGDFRKYSYGSKLNKLNYNSRTPPRYDLSKVTAPINLMWSAGDQLTPSKDAKKLLEILPNVVSVYEIPKEMSFSHVDFIWARNAHTTVNNVVIQRLKESNQKGVVISTSNLRKI